MFTRRLRRDDCAASVLSLETLNGVQSVAQHS